MKTPKPWYWAARKAWYVQINKKQIRLHEDEKKAHKEYHRIMANGGKLPRDDDAIEVPEAVERLLGSSSVEHLRKATQRNYEYALAPLAVRFRDRTLDSITPDDVIRFVAEFDGCKDGIRSIGESTRASMFRTIKTFFIWARESGILKVNPLRSTKSPWRVARRGRVMSEAEFRKVMDDKRKNPTFKEILEFLWYSGARPGEIASIEARHLDPVHPIVRLRPTEHKTGSRTGLNREIILPPHLMERLRDYAKLRPKGNLLVNRCGKKWTQRKISESFQCYRERLGLPDDLVVYMARHSFVTRMLGAGYNDAIVAKMAGHATTESIHGVYYHPETEAMLDAVKKLAEPKSPPGAASPDISTTA